MTSLADQIDRDELNCPACEPSPLMWVQDFSSDELREGVSCTCRGCGFQIAGAVPEMVEGAVRLLINQLRVEVDYMHELRTEASR